MSWLAAGGRFSRTQPSSDWSETGSTPPDDLTSSRDQRCSFADCSSKSDRRTDFALETSASRLHAVENPAIETAMAGGEFTGSGSVRGFRSAESTPPSVAGTPPGTCSEAEGTGSARTGSRTWSRSGAGPTPLLLTTAILLATNKKVVAGEAPDPPQIAASFRTRKDTVIWNTP